MIDIENLISMALFSKGSGTDIFITVAVLLLAHSVRAFHRWPDWAHRIAATVIRDGQCVRVISHRRFSTPGFGMRDDANGTNNRLLQNAIVHGVSSDGAEWPRSYTSLADSTEDMRRDRGRPRVGFGSRYRLVNLPPYDRWVFLGSGISFMRSLETSERDERDTFTIRGAKHAVDEFIHRSLEDYKQAIDIRRSGKRFLYKPFKIPDEPNMYHRYELSDDRTFDTVHFPEKEAVIALVDQFMTKTGKFNITGYPYKLGFLLHGPPGTGKTSTIKALAHHTKRHIVHVCLSKIKTNQELTRMMFDQIFPTDEGDEHLGYDEVIFVMEDVDAAGIPGRTRTEDKDKDKEDNDRVNLAGVLNVLDGIIDSPGRIVVMTSNHPELLDPALIRPGRVNMRINMSNITPQHAMLMVKRFYDDETLKDQDFQWFAQHPVSPAALEMACGYHDTVTELLAGLKLAHV